MPEYWIEGERVTCTQGNHGPRVWRCGCLEFEQRLLKYGEGFCQHVAVVLLREHDAHALLGTHHTIPVE
jgi:hypothetical protein